ncbi:helix-turn-helix transcriptional regulator [Sphaerisporangium sp. TRM90804]|uniref:helix-turn-helix transcriptional regulator n=1 Tax=Sphaerisporangium sp. TRM90804 TaxID=3031113 RepID=UPI0024492EA2|nr:helix-turn-helix transcriptional regulator [Sphaerisporangium sp. TRM90804]MDH2426081.1 helix-turn-helix transcriptional regulator [Sphaerisporangium sp. TRM90804]
MDRAQLADFLRTRREALQPEDVGLPRGPRRRTGGLRREEVAALCGMSADYYSRIEQQRGPNPSEQMLAAIARGLHLTLDERDHLFRLAGHATPRRVLRGDHINPGMLRVLDRLEDTPAQVMSHLGETLKQTRLAVALLGDESVYTGMARSAHYRWFTDPAARLIHPEEDHPTHTRLIAAHLHNAYTRDGKGSRAAAMVDALLAASPEFAEIWREHPVMGPYCGPKRIRHPRLGLLDLHCQTLVDPDQSQTLLVYTAIPGTESHEKLQLLAVIGDQHL